MRDQIQPLSSLDVFLLALIDTGVTSSYAMREQAGISVGASRPALQRLKKFGLVEDGEVEARKRLAFKLTRRGRRAKATGLNLLLEQYRENPPSDTESILRIAALAMFERKKLATVRLLKDAAEECGRRAAKFEETAKKTLPGVAAVYQSMMAECDATHFHALAGSLSKLAVAPKGPAIKPPTQRNKSKFKNKI
jgi:DNA-binding PadR family transcriptional regulator